MNRLAFRPLGESRRFFREVNGVGRTSRRFAGDGNPVLAVDEVPSRRIHNRFLIQTSTAGKRGRWGEKGRGLRAARPPLSPALALLCLAFFLLLRCLRLLLLPAHRHSQSDKGTEQSNNRDSSCHNVYCNWDFEG
jgi:hypothetical protein